MCSMRRSTWQVMHLLWKAFLSAEKTCKNVKKKYQIPNTKLQPGSFAPWGRQWQWQRQWQLKDKDNYDDNDKTRSCSPAHPLHGIDGLQASRTLLSSSILGLFWLLIIRVLPRHEVHLLAHPGSSYHSETISFQTISNNFKVCIRVEQI